MEKKRYDKIGVIKAEYHWWFVIRYRRYLSKLYDRGTPLTEKRFIRSAARLSRHCCRLQQLGAR